MFKSCYGIKEWPDVEGGILCLGCSFTTHNTAHGNHGYPYYLANLLKPEIEVWSFGLGGMGDWSHSCLVDKYKQMNPRYVIYQLIDPWRHPCNEEEKMVAEEIETEVLKTNEFQKKLNKMKKLNDFFMHRPGINYYVAEKPKEMWEPMVLGNLEYTKKVANAFSCPIIYFCDILWYPLYQYARLASSIVKLLRDADDVICYTHFGRDRHYWCLESDPHPNQIRAEKTAHLLTYYMDNDLLRDPV